MLVTKSPRHMAKPCSDSPEYLYVQLEDLASQEFVNFKLALFLQRRDKLAMKDLLHLNESTKIIILEKHQEYFTNQS